jgi:hypothetical protein
MTDSERIQDELLRRANGPGRLGLAVSYATGVHRRNP